VISGQAAHIFRSAVVCEAPDAAGCNIEALRIPLPALVPSEAAAAGPLDTAALLWLRLGCPEFIRG